jgi:hypothetical protein
LARSEGVQARASAAEKIETRKAGIMARVGLWGGGTHAELTQVFLGMLSRRYPGSMPSGIVNSR